MSCKTVFPHTFAFHPRRLWAALFCVAILPAGGHAQETTSVPHLVEFKGTVPETPPGKTGMVFALYKDQTDSVPLWQETQSVEVDAAGHYLALLGAETPDGVPLEAFNTGQARWLGVTVDGRAEQPRVLLTSVPYAMKASDAETLGGLPASAFLRGDGPAANFAAPAAAADIGTSAVNGVAGKAARPAITVMGAAVGYVPVFTDKSGDLASSLIFGTPKYVGIGTTAPAYPLSVAGIIQSSAGGFRFPDNTTQTSAVPVCLPGQNPIWSDARWACVTPSVKLGTGLTGSVASGVLTLNTSAVTSAKLGTGLTGGVASGVLTLNTSAPTTATLGSGLKGGIAGNILTLNTDTTYLQQRVTGTCVGGAIASIAQAGTVTCQDVGSGGGITFPVNWKGAAKAPAGLLNVTNTANGPAASGSTSFSTVPSAIVGTSSGSGVAIGVLGQAASTNSSAFGVGLMGYVPTGSHGGALIAYSNDGNNPTVQAVNAATSGSHTIYAGDAYGPAMNGFNITYHATPVTGTPFSASANGTDLFSVDGGGNINASGGLHISGATSLSGGVVGGLTVNNGMTVNNLKTPNNIALEVTSGLKVDGNLWVGGYIQKGSGTFKIDHPLDPANKFLYHSFVESPDMKNIYDGTIVTDSRGLATVELPSYFEALNQDFRYQLTVIGQFAQAIVAQEIANNRFTIQTDKPSVKVSWQVTGIRHDAYAEAHRVVVEEDKPAAERGTYLHPELFTPKPDDRAEKQ
jgi:hypothetical protein